MSGTRNIELAIHVLLYVNNKYYFKYSECPERIERIVGIFVCSYPLPVGMKIFCCYKQRDQRH